MNKAASISPISIIIIIIIKQRDYGGVLSEDCEDTKHKVPKKFRKCV